MHSKAFQFTLSETMTTCGRYRINICQKSKYFSITRQDIVKPRVLFLLIL